MTGFTVSAFLSRNRVSPKEAFEGLELCEGKLSCTVLRGLDGSNPVRPLGGTKHPPRPPDQTDARQEGLADHMPHLQPTHHIGGQFYLCRQRRASRPLRVLRQADWR